MSNQRQNNDCVKLCDAIRKGDKEAARNLILNNASVNNPGKTEYTPLHLAIMQFGDLEIITMLLDKGANIHVTNQHGQKPLETAIEHCNTQAAILLINSGALVGEDLNSLVVMAIKKYNDELVKVLIDKGIENDPSVDLTISLYSAMYRCLDLMKYINSACNMCIELLLKWNFTVNPDSIQDEELVFMAVKNGYTQLVSKLLELGIDVDMIHSETKVSLLKVACYYKHHAIVENLLKHNACFNVTIPFEFQANNFSRFDNSIAPKRHSLFCCDPTVRNKTCLEIAVSYCDLVIVELLLKYHAKRIDYTVIFDLTITAVELNCGEYYLHFCVENNTSDGNYNFAKLLLDRGADIHLQTPKNTLVYKAIANRHVQLLPDYPVNTQYIDPTYNTWLHKALEMNFDLEIIEKLLKPQYLVNIKNGNGQTPLHIACKSKSDMTTDRVKLLLQHNANIEAMDLRGRTPLFEACQAANHVTVKCLLDHKVNVHCVDKSGQSIIHRAVENYDTKLIEILAHTSVNFNSVDNEGNTPLYIAISRKAVDITKYLIKYGADINLLAKKDDILLNNLDTSRISNEIKETLQSQIIKLKTAGFKVHKMHLLILDKCNRYSNDLEERYCKQEIEKMKMEKVGVVNMTFYDLLKSSICNLSRFVKNQKIQQMLDWQVYNEKFPLYMDIIRCRIRDANLRYERVKTTKKYFSLNICQQLSDDCVDAVIDYLDLEDINILIKAMTTSEK